MIFRGFQTKTKNLRVATYEIYVKMQFCPISFFVLYFSRLKHRPRDGLHPRFKIMRDSLKLINSMIVFAEKIHNHKMNVNSTY